MSNNKINNDDDLIVLDQEAAVFMKSRTEAQRLQFMPSLIALLFGIILLAVTLLRYFNPDLSLFSDPVTWRTLALRQVIHFGVIPLFVASVALLIYKPSFVLLSQHKEAPLSMASAILLGIVSAFAYYLVIELLNRVDLIEQVNIYLPESQTGFIPLMLESAGGAVASLSFSVLLPTVSLVPLLLGLFLTPLLGSEKRGFSVSVTCLLGALLALDSWAFFAYLLLWIILSRIYLAGSGLITAALSCASYLAALMYSPRIFSFLSSRFIAWQSTSDLQSTLLVFALLLISLILGLPAVFHFTYLDREQRRKQLSLSLQPHIIKHIEKTKERSALNWLLIAIALILLIAALILLLMLD
ncbi:MAG: hypothetical protein PHR78_04095 [Eubacteriales bacterium]|nr:hypothetical protein [Eubacteriales bacterium]MDD4323978.1 hypothetical protein [Eubacteriales bacterium]MDD4541329.1 hypothetical protein [Eubacteriales bacterium]